MHVFFFLLAQNLNYRSVLFKISDNFISAMLCGSHLLSFAFYYVRIHIKPTISRPTLMISVSAKIPWGQPLVSMSRAGRPQCELQEAGPVHVRHGARKAQMHRPKAYSQLCKVTASISVDWQISP